MWHFKITHNILMIRQISEINLSRLIIIFRIILKYQLNGDIFSTTIDNKIGNVM